MTQLFINGQEVVLPEKFSCKKVSENPFFTKSGDYTLNITLSLLNPINAAIYKHINRLQSLSRFESRDAILISDNRVIIKGKEVVLKYTNEQIDIQIVAGNSSLNYLTGNGLNIRNLNLGGAVIDKAAIVTNLNYSYPERNWLLLPFYDSETKFVGNRYTYLKDANGNYKLEYAYNGQPVAVALFYNDLDGLNIENWFMIYENYRPQPFLCFIIDKIMQALGYTVRNEIANHPIYKYAYIVHAQDTLFFAKMLPDWTVSKFFTEIEKLFDCTVVVDNDNMNAQIVFNHNYYASSNEQNLIALDDFEAEYEEADEKMIYKSNFGYNLPDTTYYSFQNVPDDLLSKMGIDWVSGYPDKVLLQNIATRICDKPSSTADMESNKRYFSAGFILTEYREKDRNTLLPIVINDYKPGFFNPDSELLDTAFDVIPAEFSVLPYYIRERLSFSVDSYMMYQFPVARCSEEPVFQIQSDGFTRYPYIQYFIEGDASLPSEEKIASTYTQLSIAFYKADKWGLKEGKAISTQVDPLPLPFVRGISERVYAPSKDFVYLLQENEEYINPLSPKFMYHELYSKNMLIDKSKIYRMRFLSNTNPDPKGIFIFNNKRFYCRKIESVINNDGIDAIYEGEFYGES